MAGAGTPTQMGYCQSRNADTEDRTRNRCGTGEHRLDPRSGKPKYRMGKRSDEAQFRCEHARTLLALAAKLANFRNNKAAESVTKLVVLKSLTLWHSGNFRPR
jgi:hypothetical protein